MSDTIVDLTELRFLTEGDIELENELFKEFISTSIQLVDTLNQHCQGINDNKAWESASHALKGLSLNLGAAPLGDLSNKGQHMCKHGLSEKRELFQNIKAEHQRVLNFLNHQS